jgi:hypothetical protein
LISIRSAALILSHWRGASADAADRGGIGGAEGGDRKSSCNDLQVHQPAGNSRDLAAEAVVDP